MDVRGFTSLGEKVSPRELTRLMNDFYRIAADEVVRLDGTVDKFVGDQIMAFFGAPFRPHDHPERAVQAAAAIVSRVSDMAGGLQVGGGVASGRANIGNVGVELIKDYTVLGDVVNVAARLQGSAGPGEVLLTDETFQMVRDRYPHCAKRELELRGKSKTTTAWVLRVGAGLEPV